MESRSGIPVSLTADGGVTPVRPDTDIVKGFVHAFLPVFDDMLSLAHKDEGWLKVPAVMVRGLKNLNISNWPEFFVEEKKFRALQMYFLFQMSVEIQNEAADVLYQAAHPASADAAGTDVSNSTDEVAQFRAFIEELNASSVDEKTTFLNTLFSTARDIAQASDIDLPTTDEIESARRLWEGLAEVDKAKEVRKYQIAGLAFITAFYNYLALVTHGQPMTALVRRAIAGDDSAFFMAVQIDKTCLTHLAPFRERYWRAVLEGQSGFLEALSYRLRNATLRGRNRYQTLWLLFAILDDLSMLDRSTTNEAILDLYKSIPDDHVCRPIDDVDYVRKQRAAYLRLKRQTKEF